MILTCVDSCLNANGVVHTSRGSFDYIFYFLVLILQIRMLLSNTKKGEIERAFP
jgi:hypothetical protein